MFTGLCTLSLSVGLPVSLLSHNINMLFNLLRIYVHTIISDAVFRANRNFFSNVS